MENVNDLSVERDWDTLCYSFEQMKSVLNKINEINKKLNKDNTQMKCDLNEINETNKKIVEENVQLRKLLNRRNNQKV